MALYSPQQNDSRDEDAHYTATALPYHTLPTSAHRSQSQSQSPPIASGRLSPSSSPHFGTAAPFHPSAAFPSSIAGQRRGADDGLHKAYDDAVTPQQQQQPLRGDDRHDERVGHERREHAHHRQQWPMSIMSPKFNDTTMTSADVSSHLVDVSVQEETVSPHPTDPSLDLSAPRDGQSSGPARFLQDEDVSYLMPTQPAAAKSPHGKDVGVAAVAAFDDGRRWQKDDDTVSSLLPSRPSRLEERDGEQRMASARPMNNRSPDGDDAVMSLLPSRTIVDQDGRRSHLQTAPPTAPTDDSFQAAEKHSRAFATDATFRRGIEESLGQLSGGASQYSAPSKPKPANQTVLRSESSSSSVLAGRGAALSGTFSPPGPERPTKSAHVVDHSRDRARPAVHSAAFSPQQTSPPRHGAMVSPQPSRNTLRDRDHHDRDSDVTPQHQGQQASTLQASGRGQEHRHGAAMMSPSFESPAKSTVNSDATPYRTQPSTASTPASRAALQSSYRLPEQTTISSPYAHRTPATRQPRHDDSATKNRADMLEDEKESDGDMDSFTFSVGGDDVHCSKASLVAASPFLAEFLEADPLCRQIRADNAIHAAMAAAVAWMDMVHTALQQDNRDGTAQAQRGPARSSHEDDAGLLVSGHRAATDEKDCNVSIDDLRSMLSTASDSHRSNHGERSEVLRRVGRLFLVAMKSIEGAASPSSSPSRSSVGVAFPTLLSLWEIAMHFQLWPLARDVTAALTLVIQNDTHRSRGTDGQVLSVTVPSNLNGHGGDRRLSSSSVGDRHRSSAHASRDAAVLFGSFADVHPRHTASPLLSLVKALRKHPQRMATAALKQVLFGLPGAGQGSTVSTRADSNTRNNDDTASVLSVLSTAALHSLLRDSAMYSALVADRLHPVLFSVLEDESTKRTQGTVTPSHPNHLGGSDASSFWNPAAVSSRVLQDGTPDASKLRELVDECPWLGEAVVGLLCLRVQQWETAQEEQAHRTAQEEHGHRGNHHHQQRDNDAHDDDAQRIKQQRISTDTTDQASHTVTSVRSVLWRETAPVQLPSTTGDEGRRDAITRSAEAGAANDGGMNDEDVHDEEVQQRRAASIAAEEERQRQRDILRQEREAAKARDAAATVASESSPSGSREASFSPPPATFTSDDDDGGADGPGGLLATASRPQESPHQQSERHSGNSASRIGKADGDQEIPVAYFRLSPTAEEPPLPPASSSLVERTGSKTTRDTHNTVREERKQDTFMRRIESRSQRTSRSPSPGTVDPSAVVTMSATTHAPHEPSVTSRDYGTGDGTTNEVRGPVESEEPPRSRSGSQRFRRYVDPMKQSIDTGTEEITSPQDPAPVDIMPSSGLANDALSQPGVAQAPNARKEASAASRPASTRGAHDDRSPPRATVSLYQQPTAAPPAAAVSSMVNGRTSQENAVSLSSTKSHQNSHQDSHQDREEALAPIAGGTASAVDNDPQVAASLRELKAVQGQYQQDLRTWKDERKAVASSVALLSSKETGPSSSGEKRSRSVSPDVVAASPQLAQLITEREALRQQRETVEQEIKSMEETEAEARRSVKDHHHFKEHAAQYIEAAELAVTDIDGLLLNLEKMKSGHGGDHHASIHSFSPARGSSAGGVPTVALKEHVVSATETARQGRRRAGHRLAALEERAQRARSDLSTERRKVEQLEAVLDGCS